MTEFTKNELEYIMNECAIPMHIVNINNRTKIYYGTIEPIVISKTTTTNQTTKRN
jgi:hypothetical protein